MVDPRRDLKALKARLAKKAEEASAPEVPFVAAENIERLTADLERERHAHALEKKEHERTWDSRKREREDASRLQADLEAERQFREAVERERDELLRVAQTIGEDLPGMDAEYDAMGTAGQLARAGASLMVGAVRLQPLLETGIAVRVEVGDRHIEVLAQWEDAPIRTNFVAAAAESVRLLERAEAAELALDSLTNDLAAAVGHVGAPGDLLAELTRRAEAADDALSRIAHRCWPDNEDITYEDIVGGVEELVSDIGRIHESWVRAVGRAETAERRAVEWERIAKAARRDVGRAFDPERIDDAREQLEQGSIRFVGENPADSTNELELRPKTCPHCGRPAHFGYATEVAAREARPICWGECEDDCPGWPPVEQPLKREDWAEKAAAAMLDMFDTDTIGEAMGDGQAWCRSCRAWVAVNRDETPGGDFDACACCDSTVVEHCNLDIEAVAAGLRMRYPDGAAPPVEPPMSKRIEIVDPPVSEWPSVEGATGGLVGRIVYHPGCPECDRGWIPTGYCSCVRHHGPEFPAEPPASEPEVRCTACGSDLVLDGVEWPDPQEHEPGEAVALWVSCYVEIDGERCDEDVLVFRCVNAASDGYETEPANVTTCNACPGTGIKAIGKDEHGRGIVGDCPECRPPASEPTPVLAAVMQAGEDAERRISEWPEWKRGLGLYSIEPGMTGGDDHGK